MRILIIEDETDLALALQKGLTKEKYAVDVSYDGEEGAHLLDVHDYDLLLLDLNLPGKDGLEVLHEVREKKPRLRILILSARSDIDDRVKGLDLGAHDYLVKPFHMNELTARIRALLRREFSSHKPTLSVGELQVDSVRHQAWFRGQALELKRKEFAILHYFMVHAGRVISQEELLEHVWNDAVNPFTNTVRVHVNALRQKIKKWAGDIDYIRTVPGVGYQVCAPDSPRKEGGAT